MSLSTDQRLFIESQVMGRRKSMLIAYLLWGFLGLFSMHRFYLEKPKSAILQLVLNFLIVGLIWLLVDAFLIPGMIRQHEDGLRLRLLRHAG
jgi:TM2 domain-containing membrane protein YozV